MLVKYLPINNLNDNLLVANTLLFENTSLIILFYTSTTIQTKMSSIYFQITSSGYRRTDRQPPSNTQNNRHLPVYRTVNEFMDLPNKQETQNKNGTEQESSGLGINLDSNNQKNENQLSKIKFVAINTQQQYIEHQTNSIQTDDFGNEQRKLEKSLTMSQRFPKLTAIPNPSKVSMKQYTSDAKTQKSTLNLQEPEHQSAYHELQKERILRQNLEKSYRGLLQRLEKNENSSKEDQEGWNFDEFSRKQKRHATQQPMTERINKCEFKELGKQRHKNMRSSCCNFKQVELDDETKKQELDLEEQNLHLVTQNELIHQRIYEDMQFLKTKLVGVENKMLQIELHQKEQELQNITKEVSEGTLSYCSEKHHLPNRQRVQYLFTILVMFLCMAIMSKK